MKQTADTCLPGKIYKEYGKDTFKIILPSVGEMALITGDTAPPG